MNAEHSIAPYGFKSVSTNPSCGLVGTASGLPDRMNFFTMATSVICRRAIRMITATVRYKLPTHIDYAACREHFHKIAPGFREVKGLISKHFIWSESGW